MLIYPPILDVKHFDTMVCPPLGIAYLAAFVRDMVDVKVLDALAEGVHNHVSVTRDLELVGLDYKDIVARVRDFAPDMVGISCLFTNQFSSVRRLSRMIKEDIDPDIVVVSGGTHPSFLPERSLETSELDYIVLGEGESAFKALIEAHNKGTGVSDIGGLAYLENGEARVNRRVNYIEDLDSLPLPARDLLPMELYFKRNVPMGLHWRKRRNTPIITSRGCPYRCTYCSSTAHWGHRYRYRSPEKVLDEIEYLRERYGVEELKFQDDNLSLPRWRVEAILKGMIERGLDMPWNTPNGIAIWTLDEDLIRLMKKSGCYELTLAIESGDEQILKNILNKPLELAKVKEVVRLTRKHGISTMGCFIIGLPGETTQNIRNSLRFAKKLKLDYISAFHLQPATGVRTFRGLPARGLPPKALRPGRRCELLPNRNQDGQVYSRANLQATKTGVFFKPSSPTVSQSQAVD